MSASITAVDTRCLTRDYLRLQSAHSLRIAHLCSYKMMHYSDKHLIMLIIHTMQILHTSMNRARELLWGRLQTIWQGSQPARLFFIAWTLHRRRVTDARQVSMLCVITAHSSTKPTQPSTNCYTRMSIVSTSVEHATHWIACMHFQHRIPYYPYWIPNCTFSTYLTLLDSIHLSILLGRNLNNSDYKWNLTH